MRGDGLGVDDGGVLVVVELLLVLGYVLSVDLLELPDLQPCLLPLRPYPLTLRQFLQLH